VGVTVLGTGHPLVPHLVGAGAVEVQPCGLLRLGLGGVEGVNAARTCGWSGQAGGGIQELSSNRGCRTGWPPT